MSFVGDLEHLPIVDVILLHATRKSGTLCLNSTKGESQLVFRDGCIVSANHSNNSVRIGQILVQMNAISREELDKTLAAQNLAGDNRVPLIAALIEGNKIKKEDAFKGLETLIEMTIVEVLTWTEGTFELDVDANIISDEYRYIPEKLKLDLHLNTQNVLMDALRIYDEKKRDGTLLNETFPEEEPYRKKPPAITAADTIISIDDLGLDVLDDLEKVIPGFFTPVKVHDQTIVHRDKLSPMIATLPQDEQERFYSILTALSASPATTPAGESNPATAHALILFSDNEFINHTIMTACKNDNLFAFCTDEEQNLELIVNQSVVKKLLPVIVIAPPSPEAINSGTSIATAITTLLAKYPSMAIYQLIAPDDFQAAHVAIQSGARAAIPVPDLNSRKKSFVDDTSVFLDTVRSCVKTSSPEPGTGDLSLFKDCIDQINGLKELADLTAVIDRFIASIMGRAITFTTRKSDFVAERMYVDGNYQLLNVSIPIEEKSVLNTVYSAGCLLFGETEDRLVENSLYAAIPPPASRQILVLPLKCLGRVLALTCGDFGQKAPAAVQLELAGILAGHAGIVYENALYRKKFEKMLQSQN